jgi:hypothetical protein
MMMKILLTFFVVCLLHLRCDAGWAAPLTYGPKDRSSRALHGSTGTRVCYKVSQVNNVGTLLCCEGLEFTKGRKGRDIKGWRSLGCSTSSLKLCVHWGNVVAYPTVKCMGKPLGTMYSWKYWSSGLETCGSSDLVTCWCSGLVTCWSSGLVTC